MLPFSSEQNIFETALNIHSLFTYQDVNTVLLKKKKEKNKHHSVVHGLSVLSHLCLAGSSQQYMGQEEYYSEQYSHGQGSSEPMNQQYYPDGNSSVLLSL